MGFAKALNPSYDSTLFTLASKFGLGYLGVSCPTLPGIYAMPLSSIETVELLNQLDGLRTQLAASIEDSGETSAQSTSIQNQIDLIEAELDRRDRLMREEMIDRARRWLSEAMERFPRDDLQYARALKSMGSARIAAYGNIEHALPLLLQAASVYRLLLPATERELNAVLGTIAAQIAARKVESHYDLAERLFDELVPGCEPDQGGYPEVVRNVGDEANLLANFAEFLTARNKAEKLKKLSRFILETSQWELDTYAEAAARNPKIAGRWHRARQLAFAALDRVPELRRF